MDFKIYKFKKLSIKKIEFYEFMINVEINFHSKSFYNENLNSDLMRPKIRHMH